MTFLEKAKELGYSETDVIHKICPSALELEEELKRCNLECVACWNREMPNTEAKKPLFPTEDFNAGYDKGLNDAWELARKLYRLEKDEIAIIFERPYAEDVLDNYTPQEALAKLKAYEESHNFEVGDVVFADDESQSFGVVTWRKNTLIYVLWDDGSCGCENRLEEFHKTGKHIDIKSLLEQIGE